MCRQRSEAKSGKSASTLSKEFVVIKNPTLSPITIEQMLSAQLLWIVKMSIFRGRIEKKFHFVV